MYCRGGRGFRGRELKVCWSVFWSRDTPAKETRKYHLAAAGVSLA